MVERTLTITVNPRWERALHEAGRKAEADSYQGETLNFQIPAVFFADLTGKRWEIVQTLLGAGPVSLRELSQRVGRDVRRVPDDVSALSELGPLRGQIERDVPVGFGM